MRIFLPEQFGVTQERGFLPSRDPITQLPKGFAHFDEIGNQMPDLLASGSLRAAVEDLPETPSYVYLNRYELILFKIRLDFIVSAYRYQNAHLAFTPKNIRDR